MWVTQDEANMLQSNLVWIEWGGKTLTLKQWADELDVNLQGLRIRYFRRKKHNYTIEEVLFGRKRNRKSKTPKDVSEVESNRAKASKMISSYKAKDVKNGFTRDACDMTIEWMIEHIFNQPCVYCGDTHRIGCDRIDNDKPHCKSNVVPCCVECNTARNNNFSYEEMLIIGEAIKKVKNNRKAASDRGEKITIEIV